MRTCAGLLILLAAAFGLASCSSQKAVTAGQQPVAGLPKRQPQLSSVRRKVVSLLEKKNYRQAMKLMNCRKHEGMERECVQAINGLLEVGEDAFSLGDYATAVHTFKVVLYAYPVEPSIRERVSRDPEQIRSSMETCENRMMEQGLEEYRHGRLESAIRKWKELLKISPGNQEARKALDTTTVQLQRLQSLKE